MRIHFILLLALLTASSGCSIVESQQGVDASVVESSEVKNIRQVGANQYSGGQPTQAQIDLLAQSGVEHIINLRPTSEQSFEEQQTVEQSGMAYHHLPVANREEVNVENAIALRELLNELDGEASYTHCGSGNRVGALVAIAAVVVDGKSEEEAIEEGKKWGLTRLEDTARAEIAEYNAQN